MLSSAFFSENVSFFFFSQIFQLKITTYLSLHLRLFPLIFQELISDVKIDLLVAVRGDFPLGSTNIFWQGRNRLCLLDFKAILRHCAPTTLIFGLTKIGLMVIMCSLIIQKEAVRMI